MRFSLLALLLLTAQSPAADLCYSHGKAKALRESKPLLVFVGLPCEPVAGHVVCTIDSLEGYPAQCVVLSKPADDGQMWWVRTAASVRELNDPGSDALDEVNAWRASRGLPAFIRDEGLTIAARGAAAYRADRLMFGHCNARDGIIHQLGDFAFLPSGCTAAAAGCAAYPPADGWLSCCMEDMHRYGGAAFVFGRDGKRYMHLFVR